MSADPPPVLTTFLTGQPMLMSTAVAPFSSTQRAACSIATRQLYLPGDLIEVRHPVVNFVDRREDLPAEAVVDG